MNLRDSSIRWLLLSAAVIAVDQFTKFLAATHLTLFRPMPLLPGLNLTLMHNTGASFSFLSGAGGWQRWLLISLSTVVSVGIVVWMTRLPARRYLLACALALILGGAAGNLWDRVSLGYVIDFIDVYYRHWHWPAFNVADSAISVGAVLLIVDTLWFDRAQVIMDRRDVRDG